MTNLKNGQVVLYDTEIEGGTADDLEIGSTTPAQGTFTNLIVETVLRLLNDIWMEGENYAGSEWIKMFRVNTDDEIELGATLVSGSLEAVEDSGMITIFDMPVSATPLAGTEESVVFKIDGDNVLSIGAHADSSGGVTGLFVKNHGAQIVHKTDAGAADYNPSILTSDFIITVDTSLAARAVVISTEDRDSGTSDKPRMFIIKDIAGNAGTNNITVSLETSGLIDLASNAIINGDNNTLTLLVDGTDGYII